VIPRATYRLQLHKGFGFAAAARLAGYLADLGISHVYLSPILTARAGSEHGYDVVDHSRINPELGGEAEFRSLSETLRSHGIGLIVDIVPNHMAVGRADNAWWLDLLSRGQASAFAKTFDIDWDAPGLEGKVLAPFLDGTPEALFVRGDLALLHDPVLKLWCFAYDDHRFPLRPEDQEKPDADISALLHRQHFVLADWREADARLNWRRFFDVTDLAAIRIAEPEVFEFVHRRIFALYNEGLIDGVRIDHVDGIADPGAYCRALRNHLDAIRPGAWIVVEKILAEGEALSDDWGVDGTTGYDFMNEISALLHADDAGVLEAVWQTQSGRRYSFETEERLSRREILSSKFAAQLRSTVRAFSKALPNFPPDRLKQMVPALLEQLRCYRSYATGGEDARDPGSCLDRALKASGTHGSPLGAVFYRRDCDPAVVDAIRRFSQLSAPLAAKAVEDTAFYRYGRLLSRNDVGFDPRRHTLDLPSFHRRMVMRAARWPRSMLTTATHDHKRGEDARARLAVLSEVPEKWRAFVEASPSPAEVNGGDLVQLYQTLAGAWPSGNIDKAFADRIDVWCRKFLREGKLRSSWQSPDKVYESLLCGFARLLILDANFAPFRQGLATFLAAIRPAAESNSLVQAVLRNTLPGIPDLYQGCEWQDLSMVDPDNRRPVDFEAREVALRDESNRKQMFISAILRMRRDDPSLWEAGDYRGIAIPEMPDLLAFARSNGRSDMLVLALLHTVSSSPVLGEMTLDRPYRNLLTDTFFEDGRHEMGAVLESYPAAVLYNDGRGG
jgi:(1->4)-alpha-D-glucan 1-alpha-D-glucosylmutase